MVEQYFVECRCGKRERVQLFEAGVEKRCSRCHARVRVPSSVQLKESSGDRYPLLTPIEKLRQTALTREPPFDGTCHGCGDLQAVQEIPLALNVLAERHMQREGGIRPTLTGIRLDAGIAEEQWQVTKFPLLFCDPCHRRFERARRRAHRGKLFKSVFLFALLGAFLALVFFDMAIVAALSGVISLIGACAWFARLHDTKQGDRFVMPWLQNIRWAPEAIAAEEEYTLSAGPALPYNQEIRRS